MVDVALDDRCFVELLDDVPSCTGGAAAAAAAVPLESATACCLLLVSLLVGCSGSTLSVSVDTGDGAASAGGVASFAPRPLDAAAALEEEAAPAVVRCSNTSRITSTSCAVFSKTSRVRS